MTSRRACRAGAAAGLAILILGAPVRAQEAARITDREVLDGRVPVPEMTALRKVAVSWRPAVTARAVRRELFGQLDLLTAEHLRLSSGAAIRTEIEPVLETWLIRYALPTRLYPQERAIAAGILLQIDLLDEVLAARDAPRAEAERAARRRRRVRAEAERIFFDRRDVVFHVCADTLDDVQKLQAALLGAPPPAPPDLSGIKTWRDAERYLVARMEQLVETARRIP